LAEAVRNYHLPDFSNWKSLRTATNAAFARLEKDWRTSPGKSSPSHRDETLPSRVGGPSRTGKERCPGSTVQKISSPNGAWPFFDWFILGFAVAEKVFRNFPGFAKR